MSVLEAFIHDPLLDWTKNTKSPSLPKQLAMSSLATVEQKLEGRILSALPLSVEGQVNDLITTAMDLKNLCQMYVGWAPFY